MAGIISYTILYAVLIISVFQRAFAQMSTLQTGCEGATPSVQDTCPRNYFPNYDAVLTEKIRYDLQYQIPPDTQVIDLQGPLDWHVWDGGNWNATRVVTLTTVTEFITETLPPVTSTVNSLPLQTATSNEVPSTSTQDTATNPIPKPTSPEPTSTTLSNSTNSGQGNGDSFWTRTGGIISILGLVISSILGFIGVVYAIKTFYKR